MELYKSNMFDLDNLKEIKYSSSVVEGGGDGSDQKPRINTDEQDIQTMNQDDLYFYIHNYANNVFEKDLLGRNAQPFYSNGVNRIDEFMGILAVESLSNRDSTGEYTEYKPKPYNVNASLQNDFNDSYGVFQIDTGPALPYIFMTMEGANADDVRSLAQTEDMNIVMTYAKKLFENDDVKNEVYSFLKDPNNIDKHIKIAATIWNDHQLSKLKKDGAKGWNAYNNYNNKTKGKEYLDTYELYMNRASDLGLNFYKKQLRNRTERHREDLDDLKQFLNMPALGATIEEAANNLAEIYEEAVQTGQIPDEAAPVDYLKDLGNMFRR